MPFTRSFLKSIGLNEEQVSAVMEEHTAVTTALKQQRDELEGKVGEMKAAADKLPALEKELEALKAQKNYKEDYDRAVQELTDYKAQISKEAEAAKIRAAYKQLLTDEHISDRRHEAIMKVTDFSGMKLGEDGALADAKALREAIGKEWGEFRVNTRQRGENVDHPPREDNGQPLGDIREMGAKRRAEKYGALPKE